MKLIYVASPYAGDIELNTAFAREACQFVKNEGHAFWSEASDTKTASHPLL